MDFDRYEREGWAEYAALTTAIAEILTAAISAEEEYRLQQVTGRAKQPASLRKKLEQRGIAATTKLEDEIKDLAGCRIIFYTNSDVTRLISSGIIDQNFEVLEVKLHHPRRTVEDAAELYISNHYIVRLRPERIALPEYARFSGMRCEIQIQTILNHAWAEMAHDTIYKAPALGDFGGKAFEGIRSQMQKVARKYLLPAGYEFQKIASDFQRLIEGKALFDGDALDAIVGAANNNVRADALDTFAENVLPLYDDPQEIYPEIVTQLIEAASRARSTPPTAIETPYGPLPAKTSSDIAEAITSILTRYRYLDIDQTFEALRILYGWAENEDEQKPLLELGKALAKHHLHAWNQCGPRVQAILVESIGALNDEERHSLETLLSTMLDQILSSELSGTTNSSSTVTIHRGTVVASEELRIIRTKAIDLLKHQFKLAESNDGRRIVLQALQAATRTPIGAIYSNELAHLIMEDTHTILAFQREIAPTLSYELLQATEERIHQCYWRYADLPESMQDDPDLVVARGQLEAATLAFRDVANADTDYVIYKTLVGYNSVFPPAWDSNEFNYEQVRAYRAKQADALLVSINESNADAWFDRINRYARTESDDAATFPVFGKFLERLAEAQPSIAFNYIDRLDGPLANFLPSMLTGLVKSTECEQALARIDAWLQAGEYISHIAWYLRSADPFDEALLRRAFDSAIEHNDRHAVRHALNTSVSQFTVHPGTLVEEIFLPALRYLKATDDFSWVHMPAFSWLNKPIIQALDQEQARVVLDTLVSYHKLEYGAEFIAATIAERWPENVVAFIGERLAFARTDAAPPRYDAIPFEVHQLQSPLAAAPDILLDGAHTWFNAYQEHFTYDGGKLLASVFPDLSHTLDERLAELIAGGREQDLKFVLGVLSAFEGKPCIYELVRTIIAALNPDSSLLGAAEFALDQSGMVSGAFGFAELYAERKTLVETWLADPNATVQIFATEQIHKLDRRIAAENRSAEASIALRKLEYGEELDDSKAE